MSVWASWVSFYEDDAPYVYHRYGELGKRSGFFDLAVIPGDRSCARVSLGEEYALFDPEQIRELWEALDKFLTGASFQDTSPQ
jgi:hypothetical protein